LRDFGKEVKKMFSTKFYLGISGILVLIFIASLTLAVISAQAVPIYGTDVDLNVDGTGTRTVPPNLPVVLLL
jgi:hypothetical protein